MLKTLVSLSWKRVVLQWFCFTIILMLQSWHLMRMVVDLGMPIWSIGANGYFRLWSFSTGSANVDNVEKDLEALLVIAIVTESPSA